MAKLTSFIYCLNAERQPSADGKGENLNAVGVLSSMTPEFIPGTFSFSIIFSVLGVDVKETNTIQIVFKNEDNQSLLDTGVISLPSLDGEEGVQLPPEYKGYNMSMDFRNIVFEKNGVYHTEVFANGVLLGSPEIYVKGRRGIG